MYNGSSQITQITTFITKKKNKIKSNRKKRNT